MDRKELGSVFAHFGFDDFKWIDGQDIVVKHWVRFKCRFMCDEYGASAVCPPNIPSVRDCREFFAEYDEVAILRKHMTYDARTSDEVLFEVIDENLLELEEYLFFAGYYKVFALPMTVCYQCDECTGDIMSCKYKDKARPNPEALGVDVFQTVRNVGYPLEVLKRSGQEMNRYAFLLIE